MRYFVWIIPVAAVIFIILALLAETSLLFPSFIVLVALIYVTNEWFKLLH